MEFRLRRLRTFFFLPFNLTTLLLLLRGGSYRNFWDDQFHFFQVYGGENQTQVIFVISESIPLDLFRICFKKLIDLLKADEILYPVILFSKLRELLVYIYHTMIIIFIKTCKALSILTTAGPIHSCRASLLNLMEERRISIRRTYRMTRPIG